MDYGLGWESADVPKKFWPTEASINDDTNEQRLAVIFVRNADESRIFIVQTFLASFDVIRLTVSETGGGATKQNEAAAVPVESASSITWDELQSIKAVAGYADREAVEIFPREQDLVRVKNLRHLWVLSEPLRFSWRGGDVTLN